MAVNGAAAVEVHHLDRGPAAEGDAAALTAANLVGGLVDVEYLVQGLQIAHGQSNPALRTPRIHEALEALGRAGVAVDPRSRRAYVALSGEDQVEVLDLATGEDRRRIALRTGAGTGATGLKWLLTDHLGSTSKAANADGTLLPGWPLR